MPYKLRWPRLRSPKDWLLAFLIGQLICLLLWAVSWPQPVVTLSFLVEDTTEEAAWAPIINDFHTTHPNIRIRLRTNPDNIPDPFTTDVRSNIHQADFQTRQPPQYDIVYMDTVWTAPFAKNLKALNGLVRRDNLDLDAFLDSEIAAGTVDGKLYRLPMMTEIGLLYYRKDWLAAVGKTLPTTIDELDELVTAIKDSPKGDNLQHGYLWQGFAYEGLITNFVEVLGGAGGALTKDEQNYIELDNPQAAEAVETMSQLITRGISPTNIMDYTEQSSQDEFRKGKSLFLRTWPSFWKDIQQEPWKDNIGIAPPFSFLSGEQGKGCRGGWGFGISQKSRHQNEAWEAIKYLTGEKAQQAYSASTGSLPTRPALFPAAIKNNPMMENILSYLDSSSVFRPSLKNYSQESTDLQAALSSRLAAAVRLVSATP
ncbi:MAG: extracellular solute-binding protein [Cyanobacteria bacterium J06560_2]